MVDEEPIAFDKHLGDPWRKALHGGVISMVEGTVLRTGNQVAVINVDGFQGDSQRIATGRAVYSLKPAGLKS